MKNLIMGLTLLMSMSSFAVDTVTEGDFVTGLQRTTTTNQSINRALYELIASNQDTKQLWGSSFGRAFDLQTLSQRITCTMRWDSEAKDVDSTVDYSCEISGLSPTN